MTQDDGDEHADGQQRQEHQLGSDAQSRERRLRRELELELDFRGRRVAALAGEGRGVVGGDRSGDGAGLGDDRLGDERVRRAMKEIREVTIDRNVVCGVAALVQAFNYPVCGPAR